MRLDLPSDYPLTSLLRVLQADAQRHGYRLLVDPDRGDAVLRYRPLRTPGQRVIPLSPHCGPRRSHPSTPPRAA